MRRYLLFRLFGVLSSWGGIAVGEERPSSNYPSKSALIGFLSACKGFTRSDETALNNMAKGLGMAVVMLSPVKLLCDYHTAQVPPARRGVKFHTRKDEVQAVKLETILSRRSYIQEGDYAIVIWKKSEIGPKLEELSKALINPVFTPYLGRKSCPLCLPVRPTILEGKNLRAILSEYEVVLQKEMFTQIHEDNHWLVYWEGDDDSGLDVLHTSVRNDYPINRRKWLFSKRNEHFSIFRRERR